ncbi:MAG: VOC family protein [Magnetococcales bacterium]|nr:VOC family protein [Magnetococcales bacterium]
MTQKINLVTLGVNDLDEAILFYEDALGFTSMAQEGSVAIFNLSNSWLALLPKVALIEHNNWNTDKEDPLLPSVNFLTHHVNSKAVVDEVIMQAVDAGAKLFKAPEDQDIGGYAGYFTDLDGHLWQVVWNPHYCNSQDSQKNRISLPN